MRQDLTDIVVILDRSGSMASIRTDTEGGFNNFVDEQRKQPGDCRLTLTQFDTVYDIVYANKPIRDVPALKLEPRGGTALLDAMAKTITETGQRLAAMPEDARPGKVVVVVITDGEENSSQEFGGDKGRQRVMEMVKQQSEAYKWTFIFLGANQDAIAAAVSMGISASNSMTYAANAVGTRSSYISLSANVIRLRAGKGTGDFTQKDRDDQTAAGVTP